ncbi:MAG: DegQ family serine endoprotease [Pseudomonadota bacterium]|nr:DegQ family serine endoprotease [Pseudomonadota bacterium]
MRTNDNPSLATRGGIMPLNASKVFARSAIAGALVLAIAGTQLATSTDATATLALSQPVSEAGIAGPPSFAEVAARVTPAVVNVAVVQEGGAESASAQIEIPQLPDGSPFGEFFRRFFDEKSLSPKGFDIPRRAKGQGSGFIIDPDGHIVTNNHVVEKASEVQVILNDGSRYQAEIKGRDPKTDLALLKIDADKPLPYVTFGSSETARVGDWVLAVGNPFGLGGSVSAGIISARGRDINSGPYDDYLQIDAPINRGNSGGPLFDAGGRVIGINAAIYSPSGGNVGIGFAIPASTAASVIAQLRKHGRIERGWLGVQIQSVTEDVAESLGLESPQGALVASVVPDSPAAKAGLQPGDVILTVDGTAVEELKTLPRLIADTTAGAELGIEIHRNGSMKKLSVVIGQMPTQEKIAATPQEQSHDSGPRLGLYLAPLTPEAREAHGVDERAQGVLVAEVEDGSPAQKAGIKPGSLISMVGQQVVGAPEDVVTRVREAIDGDRSTVLLLIEQDGEKRFVTVRFAA